MPAVIVDELDYFLPYSLEITSRSEIPNGILLESGVRESGLNVSTMKPRMMRISGTEAIKTRPIVLDWASVRESESIVRAKVQHHSHTFSASGIGHCNSCIGLLGYWHRRIPGADGKSSVSGR